MRRLHEESFTLLQHTNVIRNAPFFLADWIRRVPRIQFLAPLRKRGRAPPPSNRGNCRTPGGQRNLQVVLRCTNCCSLAPRTVPGPRDPPLEDDLHPARQKWRAPQQQQPCGACTPHTTPRAGSAQDGGTSRATSPALAARGTRRSCHTRCARCPYQTTGGPKSAPRSQFRRTTRRLRGRRPWTRAGVPGGGTLGKKKEFLPAGTSGQRRNGGPGGGCWRKCWWGVLDLRVEEPTARGRRS